MSATERDPFNLGGDSDNDDSSQGYNSDDDLQKGARSSKRRRVDSDAEDDEDIDDLSDAEEGGAVVKPSTAAGESANSAKVSQPQDEPLDGAEDDELADEQSKRELPGLPNALTKKNLVITEAAIKKSGVVYLSRIPPFMKPHKLRSLLEPYGKVNRIFLAPESDEARSRRLRGGGNRKKLFTEGWVEFVKKGDAKAVCELLNARTIGGKKGSYYRDDVWTLLYLKGFKWHNLTEQISNENAERSSRMRAEVSKATKENRAFVRNVEQAKMLDGIKSKTAAKRKRAAEEDGADGADDKEGESKGRTGAPLRDNKRHFQQTQIARKRDGDQPEQVARVLSKIF